MQLPQNSHYLSLFQPNPPKLSHKSFTFFTFYYTLHNNLYYPIFISKPNSTQPPHVYLNTSPTFPTLQQLLNYYTNPSNNPLK